jgi:hypothetical protein
VYWHVVLAVASSLLERRVLTGEEVEALIRDVRSK